VDLNTTIDCLRSLSDVLRRLYRLCTMAYDEDSNGCPLSLSLSSSNLNDPLAQGMTELHALGGILETANWPSSMTDLANTLDNLNRIEAELDAHGRSVYGSLLTA
jgi:hypothetical protein